MKRLKQGFFKWLTGVDVKNIASPHIGRMPSMVSNDEELNSIYLFNFRSVFGNQNESSVSIPTGGLFISDVSDSEPDAKSKIPTKIKMKPVDVLHELETVPTPFDCLLIDQKIDILKDKREIITQSYAKREVEALIERMENRKHYLNDKAFFDRFMNTTDEKIDTLLEKYELVMKPADIFIPEFPDDAVKIMKDYTAHTKKICDKKPVFYVIATSDNFKQADKKRDPILLVQSPFGFYWQILGAWDKEMILLSEL